MFDQPEFDNGALWIDSVGLFNESTIAGDYNGDGVVDAADIAVWREAVARGDTALPNDATPGMIDESDYFVWVENFGAVAASAAEAVPEPTGSVLAASVCLACGLRRR